EKENIEKNPFYDSGFLIVNDSTIITANSLRIEEWDSTSSTLNLFSEFKIKDGAYQFNKHFPYQVTNELFPNTQFGWGRTYFFNFHGKKYAMLELDNHIYCMDNDKPVASLVGDGTLPYPKEEILQYIEGAGYKVNYHVYSVSPIMNNSHLAIIYAYKNKLMMEIKNSSLKTIYTNDFTNIKGFEQFYEKKHAKTWGNFFPIQNDTIYFMALEDEEYKLFRYLIKPACNEE
ncbi:MAG: hypothetical protein H0X63_07615, partial [Flavobacteriales bacterium]|nr:hypothetical protein [Flavobacteriales bacterium]